MDEEIEPNNTIQKPISQQTKVCIEKIERWISSFVPHQKAYPSKTLRPGMPRRAVCTSVSLSVLSVTLIHVRYVVLLKTNA